MPIISEERIVVVGCDFCEREIRYIDMHRPTRTAAIQEVLACGWTILGKAPDVTEMRFVCSLDKCRESFAREILQRVAEIKGSPA